MLVCTMPECQTTAGCVCGRRHAAAMANDADRIIARWQAEGDETDRRLARVIDDICRRAGATNDYPTPLAVRSILELHGLLVQRR